MPDVLGYSEANTLTSCERKWWYINDQEPSSEDAEKSQALSKGTALHGLIAGWETGDEAAAYVRLNEMIEAGVLDSETAMETVWLFERYKRWYGDRRLRIIANELPLIARIPGTRTWFSTRGADAIVQVPRSVDPEHAGLWHLERKTMKDWQRLIVLPVDQQVTTVLWLLREAGWEVRGTIFDAIRTYRFQDVVPTQAELKLDNLRQVGESASEYNARIRCLQQDSAEEAPLEDSFRRVFLERTSDQIDGQLAELKAVAARWRQLRLGATPARNIDRSCGWCSFKDDCWRSLITNDDTRLIDSVRARAAR